MVLSNLLFLRKGRSRFKTRLTSIAIAAGLALSMVVSTFLPAQALPYVVPHPNDPLLANLGIPADAPQKGMWASTQNWPLVAIHAGVLPDGKVITFGTPLGQGIQDGRVFDVWDPSLGFAPTSHTTSANAQGVNSFCGSATHLPSGSLLISGGNTPLEGTLFNPLNVTATATPNLNFSRWYSSMITLADGRALMTGGTQPYISNGYQDPIGYINNNTVAMTPEVYAPGTGWTLLTGATSRDAFGPDFNRFWYPRNWVAPNGKVFGISSETLWSLDPSGTGSMQVLGKFKTGADEITRPNIGPTSTAVMYDTGKILQVGGNGYTNGYASTSSKFATLFDINTAGFPVIQETAPMNFGRQWANATVLPTGQVLINGGTRFADNGDPDAVHETEIWDPQTGQWTIGARATDIRNYHSSAILLPNGTVMTAGGGVPGPVTNLNAAIYYPPYLFTTINGQPALATRPVLQSMDSNRMAYNSTLQVQMANADVITKVSLIGLSNGTHSFNSGQRLYNVSFSQNAELLTLTTPLNANIAPPGYYQIFAVNANGVPSTGAIVAVGDVSDVVALVTTKYEAEQANKVLGGNAGVYNVSSVSGGQIVGNITGSPASFSKVTGIDGGSGGKATLRIGYANANSGTRQMKLYVNDTFVQIVDFAKTASWGTIAEAGDIPINLNAGTSNSIKLEWYSTNNVDVDYYKVTIGASTSVPVTGVSVSPTTASITGSGTSQLTATVLPTNASNKNVSWSSSNPSVATVNANGLVSSVAPGSAIVTVTTQDGGFTATSTITVNSASVSVTGVGISPTTASITGSGTSQLTATVLPTNASNKNVSWSSSNPSVATVNANGLVSSMAPGSAIVTVTTQDGGFTATSTITVNSVVVAPVTTQYEAEQANKVLGGNAGVYNVSTVSGRQIVGNITGGTASFSKITGIDGGSGGTATLRIGYANANSGTRQMKLYVNDTFVQIVDFAKTASWGTVAETGAIPIYLNAGTSNSIKLEWYLTNNVDVDYYKVSK